MKIIENRNNRAAPEEILTKQIKCDKCGSVLEITDSDKHIGWLGAKFVTCPCCGGETMIEDEDGIILTVDNIQFPSHFYRTNKSLRNVKEIYSEEIENEIRHGITYFRKNKDEFAWYTSYGDIFITIFRFTGDKEYLVVVSKDFYETDIPFAEADYD